MAREEKVLSIFVDESGDFGEFNKKSPYYMVTMVLHDQREDISSQISFLDEKIKNLGFPPT